MRECARECVRVSGELGGVGVGAFMCLGACWSLRAAYGPYVGRAIAEYRNALSIEQQKVSMLVVAVDEGKPEDIQILCGKDPNASTSIILSTGAPSEEERGSTHASRQNRFLKYLIMFAGGVRGYVLVQVRLRFTWLWKARRRCTWLPKLARWRRSR